MKHLLKQFSEIKVMPIFEIEDSEGEYHVFYIVATTEGLEAGGASNIGFLRMNKGKLFVEWDDTFSLDEHLQELHEYCTEYAENY